MRANLLTLLALLALCSGSALAGDYVNSELPWHEAVVDSQGKLLAWSHPEKNLGYDRVLHLAWDFIEHRIPNDAKSGLKVYLVNSVFDGKTLQGSNGQGNPASTFGEFVDSLIAWYPYSGDNEAIKVVRSMLDHHLAHGTTPADWNWPNVPFATNLKNDPEYGKNIHGMPPEFYGGIETDKVGELGVGYCLFFELTGDKKYLAAAIHCADALASHIREGDETHTPWPFRVDARSGATLDQAEYGGMIVAPVRLFTELVRLKEGDFEKYETARKTAWAWILKYPMHNGRWIGYFEDVRSNTENFNQASPTMTAYYLLTQPDPESLDPRWRDDVGRLIDLVRRRLGRGPFLGAWGIDEQGPPPDYIGCCSRAGLGSDTSRWAAINAMFYEKTGDLQAREDAFRSSNYATYFCDDEGKVSCCGVTHWTTYWFSDGYADYLRHFLWTMGAIPEFAPVGENHLLRCSSVVTHVAYNKSSIQYRTFDCDASEVLRLTSGPTSITAGGAALSAVEDLHQEGYRLQSLPNGEVIVRIHHRNAKEMTVSWQE